MIRDKISLGRAIKLESESILTLYYPSTSFDDLPDIPYIERYTENFISYAKEHSRKPVDNLLHLLSPEYEIEIEMPFEQETGTFHWVRLFGKVQQLSAAIAEDKHRGWVYLLMNPAYPELVKIGKAVTPSQRLKGINGAGTVDEWILKAAMPVSEDYTVESLMHTQLAQYRRDSNQGSSREFFEVPLSLAMKTLLEVSEPFKAGDLVLY